MSTEMKVSDLVVIMSVPEASEADSTSTSTSTTVASASAFHGFPKLPPELRLMIWEEARPEARVVKLSKSKSWLRPRLYDTYSKAKTPAMLHANHESRTVALKWYTIPTGCAGYLDLSRDYQYIQCRCKGKECSGYMDCITSRVVVHGFPPYRFIMPTIVSSRIIFECNEETTDRVLSAMANYRGELTELLLVDVKKGLGDLNEGNLSDFVETKGLFRPRWNGLPVTLMFYYHSLRGFDVGMKPLKKIRHIQRKDLGKYEDIRLIQALERIERSRGSSTRLGWLILALVAYFIVAYNLRGFYARHKWRVLANVVYLVVAFILWLYLQKRFSIRAMDCFAGR